MVVALAKTGGVVNVIFYPEHIEPGYAQKKEKVDSEIASLVARASDEEKGDAAHKKLARDQVRREEYLKRLPPVTVSRIVDHIDHVVKLVGIDHVGIGSDFDAVQIFSRNPRGWMAKPLTNEAVALFRKTRKQTKLAPVLIHTNYLINLAAADETILLKSIASFREEVERAILLGVDYLVLHPGSARGSCEADAIEICALSLQLACKGLKLGGLRILLENTAGQGECIGHRFEHLRAIMEACPKLPLGACIDTAHSFTAGYDFREPDGLETMIEIIRRTLGLKNVR